MSTTTLDPAIRVQGITKSFKELEVLRGVDFDVAPGTHLRPARLQRGRQDHARPHPRDPAEGRRRHRQRRTGSTSRPTRRRCGARSA